MIKNMKPIIRPRLVLKPPTNNNAILARGTVRGEIDWLIKTQQQNPEQLIKQLVGRIEAAKENVLTVLATQNDKDKQAPNNIVRQFEADLAFLGVDANSSEEKIDNICTYLKTSLLSLQQILPFEPKTTIHNEIEKIKQRALTSPKDAEALMHKLSTAVEQTLQYLDLELQDRHSLIPGMRDLAMHFCGSKYPRNGLGMITRSEMQQEIREKCNKMIEDAVVQIKSLENPEYLSAVNKLADLSASLSELKRDCYFLFFDVDDENDFLAFLRKHRIPEHKKHEIEYIKRKFETTEYYLFNNNKQIHTLGRIQNKIERIKEEFDAIKHNFSDNKRLQFEGKLQLEMIKFDNWKNTSFPVYKLDLDKIRQLATRNPHAANDLMLEAIAKIDRIPNSIANTVGVLMSGNATEQQIQQLREDARWIATVDCSNQEGIEHECTKIRSLFETVNLMIQSGVRDLKSAKYREHHQALKQVEHELEKLDTEFHQNRLQGIVDSLQALDPTLNQNYLIDVAQRVHACVVKKAEAIVDPDPQLLVAFQEMQDTLNHLLIALPYSFELSKTITEKILPIAQRYCQKLEIEWMQSKSLEISSQHPFDPEVKLSILSTAKFAQDSLSELESAVNRTAYYVSLRERAYLHYISAHDRAYFHGEIWRMHHGLVEFYQEKLTSYANYLRDLEDEKPNDRKTIKAKYVLIKQIIPFMLKRTDEMKTYLLSSMSHNADNDAQVQNAMRMVEQLENQCLADVHADWQSVQPVLQRQDAAQLTEERIDKVQRVIGLMRNHSKLELANGRIERAKHYFDIAERLQKELDPNHRFNIQQYKKYEPNM
ncbi:hypothetical protein [Candidatus Sarmatiella mevalonica]|uniref:hypothetical protein n=1 Tax=Candidatus Sarmatiella mevalonica TaxID=2770581 RepID=UPI00192283C3|nr:hypothetical protein [Candidatus Sarmatiella mevalonica]